MKSRVIIIFLWFFTLWSGLVFRGAFLQVLPNEKLEELKKKRFYKTVKIPGRRGAIFDRDGKDLAVSISAYSLFADPKILKNPAKTAKFLSKKLNLPYKKLLKRLKQKKKRFVWIRRRLDKPLRDEIRAKKIYGLGFFEEPKRIYPNGSVLSQVIGFTGSNGRGLEGLERKFDKVLTGKEKKVVLRRDARGRTLPTSVDYFSRDLDGKNIFLTIDRDLQFELENELRIAVEKNEAKSAVGIVMDPSTSEVLAMANYPGFDLNEPFKNSTPTLRKNRCVTDAYEPGSTMKTILIASALSNDVITPNKKYFCENGKFKIGRRTIGEADKRHHFGWLSASEILVHSSNIGTSKIGLELGDKKYRQTLLDFGFGSTVGENFPGEARGILHALPWRDHLLANISFGHGVAVTPLQMVAAYSAIANGGVWRTPKILKEIRDSFDEEIDFETRFEERRVMSEKTAETMRLMLAMSANSGGTSVNTRVPGFPVAGKTGTAQKVSQKGGYEAGAYISSFAGMVPANSPKFVIYVAVDSAKKVYYGSQVAAPVFANVARFAVRKARLSPVVVEEQNIIAANNSSNESLRGESGVRLGDEKSERAVAFESPANNKNEYEEIGLDPELSEIQIIAKQQQVKMRLVPNLKGLTLREVFKIARSQRIEIRAKGSGTVTKSYPPAGFPLGDERKIEVRLSLSEEREKSVR